MPVAAPAGLATVSGTSTPTPTDPTPNDEATPQPTADWPALLGALCERRDLDRSEARSAMADILAGAAGPARIAGLLIGLAAKGETVDELTGLVTGMLEAAEPLRVDPGAIDIVGTGGSAHRRAHALNVSTMACIVASAAGAVVCKHGNVRASSTSGSFDFLQALGVAIDLGPEELAACVDEIGLGFAFARRFHPAMRFAGPVRADLGVPTVFNLLGPLAHPGRLTRQVVGVASRERGESLARVLRELGSTSAWVVAGGGGLDELTTADTSDVWQVTPDGVEMIRVDPTEFGLERVAGDRLAGGGPEENVAAFEALVAGTTGPVRDIVTLNAGAGLVVAGLVDSLADGVRRAAEAIDDGRVEARLADLRTVTNRLVAAS